jgi:hypothetical protein
LAALLLTRTTTDEEHDFGCSAGSQELTLHTESIEFTLEKTLKKVLTLEGQIQYHGGRFQNRQRTFAR